MNNYLQIARQVVQAADNKLGINIVALEVGGHSSITDVLVFVGATSHLHVQALEDAIRENLRKDGISPLRADGQRGHLWRALDYGCVIVHIMEQKIREFYAIERLWDLGKPITDNLLVKPKVKVKKAAKAKKPAAKRKPKKKTR